MIRMNKSDSAVAVDISKLAAIKDNRDHDDTKGSWQQAEPMDMYRRREEVDQDTTEIPPEEFFSIYDISEERIEIAGTKPAQTEVRLKLTLRETKQESTKDIHKRPKVVAVIDPVRKMDAADPNWCRQELMLKTAWGIKDSWPIPKDSSRDYPGEYRGFVEHESKEDLTQTKPIRLY